MHMPCVGARNYRTGLLCCLAGRREWLISQAASIYGHLSVSNLRKGDWLLIMLSLMAILLLLLHLLLSLYHGLLLDLAESLAHHGGIGG